jgi:hypothetical protein
VVDCLTDKKDMHKTPAELVLHQATPFIWLELLFESGQEGCEPWSPVIEKDQYLDVNVEIDRC